MGGWGSGRKNYSKLTVESHPCIDIRWLKKKGYLRSGSPGRLGYSRHGKTLGTISYRAELDGLRMHFSCGPVDDKWVEVAQVAKFDWTPCNYGGKRVWLLCPQCGKRVVVLYVRWRKFLCRHCLDINYSSQHESRPDRLMRKALRIRERLGASTDLNRKILFKPKYMHEKTFDRLRREAEYADSLAW